MINTLFRNSFLTLTYFPDEIQDGIGAQSQRIWKIYAIACKFRLLYIHTPIKKTNIELVSLTRTNKLMHRQVLKSYNKKILLPSGQSQKIDVIKKYSFLTRKDLFINYFSSLIRRQNVLLQVVNSFQVKVSKLPYDQNFYKLHQDKSVKKIIIHIRNAQPIYGKKDWRNLDINYYLKIHKAIVNQLKRFDVGFETTIFTDYPKFSSKIPMSQIKTGDLWYHFLSEEELMNKFIFIQGIDIKKLYFPDDKNVTVIHGGSEIKAIDAMVRADYLVLSRSSFSAAAGILNNSLYGGVVIVPPDFIFLKQKSWKNASEFIKIEPEWRLQLLEKILRIYFIKILVRHLLFVRIALSRFFRSMESHNDR
jgi:hypothetical protein